MCSYRPRSCERMHVYVVFLSLLCGALQAPLFAVCVWKANMFQFFKSCSSVLPLYLVLCTTSVLPPLQSSYLEEPAGPAWRWEGGPSVPSSATWLPRGEGGVEGAGAEEEGRGRKMTFSSPLQFLFFSSLLLPHPVITPSLSALSHLSLLKSTLNYSRL